MSESMVERVADRLRLCGLERNAEYFARQAIEAMREPTEGMKKRWAEEAFDRYYAQDWAQKYRWCIDEALK